MLSSQNIQNICFSDSQLQSLTPHNQVSYFNRMNADKINSFGTNGQVNLDSLCEKVFINNRTNMPGSDSKQLFNSQGESGLMKRVSSEQQLINIDRIPSQNYHERDNLMKMMRQPSVETIKQKQLQMSHGQHHQDSKIYQNQINQQPSIGRASPPYNG